MPAEPDRTLDDGTVDQLDEPIAAAQQSALAEPDGPITAVTARSGNASVTSNSDNRPL